MIPIIFTIRPFFQLPQSNMGFPGGSVVKNPPIMQESQETWVQSLGWEDPLEEGMATHSSILAWRILMDRGAWWATVHRVTTRLSMCACNPTSHPD